MNGCDSYVLLGKRIFVDLVNPLVTCVKEPVLCMLPYGILAQPAIEMSRLYCIIK